MSETQLNEVTEDLAGLRRQLDDVEARVYAANREAARKVRALLELPETRPGAWEAAHVEALEDELRGLRDTLEPAVS